MRLISGFVTSVVLTTGLSIIAAEPSLALKTATATVSCPKAKLQSAIDNAVAGVPTTINVSGICSELIEVPTGKTIKLVGKGVAEIRPPSGSTSLPVISNLGDLTLQQMKVTNTAVADSMVVTAGNSRLYIVGSTLNGPSVSIPLEIAEASVGKVFNSVLQGGTDEALLVSSQSTLEIFGRPTVMAHFDSSIGYTTRITTPANTAAFSCEQGGNLVIRAEGAGRVEANNSVGAGLNISQCNVLVRNRTGSSASVKITAAGNAIQGALSQLRLESISLKSSQYCISLTRSVARATGLVYSSCTSGTTNLDNSFVDVY